MRRRLRIALLVIAVPVVLVAVANAVVLLQARGGTAGDVAALPHAQAALVLGAQVKPDGTPSDMLADRIATAEALLFGPATAARAGSRLLLSGDHGRVGYDEVGTMRRVLLADGIPARDLFTDHAGFDTWDSAQRAQRVFGVDSAIVVTQRFHLPRALFAARRAGLDATGFAADRRASEAVARPKAETEGGSWAGCNCARRSRA